jgi:predicted Ser/Thr protein kinase
MLNREFLNRSCRKIEKPAGIANPKDFRNEVVKFTLRARAQNGGTQSGLDELRKAARSHREAHVLSGGRSAAGHQLRLEEGQATEKQHAEFVQRMIERGYTGARFAAGRMVHAGQQGRLMLPKRGPKRGIGACRISSTAGLTRRTRALATGNDF